MLNTFFGKSIFVDEILSIFFANSRSFWKLFSDRIEVIHPNGFYIFLKFLFLFSDSIIWVRAWMVVILLTSFWLVFKLADLLGVGGKDKQSKWRKLFFVLPFLTSAYIWRFGLMLRMYGLGILLMLSSLFFLLKFLEGEEKKERFFWWGILLDILAMQIVTGYGVWLVLKLVIFIWMSDVFRSKKWLGISLVETLFLLGWPILKVLQQVARTSRHIGWMKPTAFHDLGLSLFSFMGGGLFLYFEGMANISDKYRMFGLGLSVGVLLLSVFGVLKLLKLWKSREILSKKTGKILELLAWLVLVGYTIGILGSRWLQLSVLHIRQLFVVAAILTLGLGWFLAKFEKRWLVIIVLLSFLGLSGRSLFQNYFLGNLPYPPYSLAQAETEGQNWLISPNDAEFAYHNCGAVSFYEIENRCREKNVFINRDKLMTLLKEGDNFKVVTTQTPANFVLPENWCTQEEPLVYGCTMGERQDLPR